MERLLQYLDDLDDLAGAAGLMYESCRRLLIGLVQAAIGLLIVGATFWLALAHPVIAIATCLLLVVTLLYPLMVHDSTPDSA